MTAQHSNSWLDLDLLLVARAAHACSAHFTCLYFLELHAEQHPQSEVMERTSLLAQACTLIGEPDSLYGLETTHDLQVLYFFPFTKNNNNKKERNTNQSKF